MTVRVDLPDGRKSAPINNKFLIKYAPAGEMKARLIYQTREVVLNHFFKHHKKS